MKTVGMMLLLLGLTMGAWGETLALTIEYDNGDPSEERDVWTAKYYTDEDGRLSREVRVTKAQFVGEPDKTEETTFEWFEKGVRWIRAEDPNAITANTNGVTRHWFDGGSTPIELLPGPGVQWRDDYYEHRWSAIEGYSSRSVIGPDGRAKTKSTWVTKGSRLSLLHEGRVTDFLLLDRSPQHLVATFYGNFLEENGWVPTGTVVLHGSGLNSNDSWVRLAMARIIYEELHIPVWPAFVF